MYRGIENGERIERGIKYSPKLFFRSDKEEQFKTLDGINVKSCSYMTIKDAKEFIYEHKDVVGFDLFGYHRFEYCYLEELFPNKIDFNFKKLKIINFDIECPDSESFPEPDRADTEIISIAMSYNDRYYVFGLNNYVSKESNVKFIKCSCEKELLIKFLRLWKLISPDIVTGWNIIGFDIPYIINRMTRILDFDTVKELSPFNYINQIEINLNSQQISTFDIYGIEILDYLHLYKKFTFKKLENYRLDTVAFAELGSRKIDYSEFGSLRDLYLQDYEKFIDYNIKDVGLVNQLENKLRLIEMIVTTAYDAKINFSEVFFQVKIWENIIYSKLIKNNIVFPAKKRHNKNTQFRGAYVKESQVGMFDWIASYDVNSLYPSLLVQYNISPETLTGKFINVDIEDMLAGKVYNISEDECLTASGYSFDKTRTGFLPDIIEEMMKERFMYKAKQIEYEKDLEKINNRIKQLEA